MADPTASAPFHATPLFSMITHRPVTSLVIAGVFIVFLALFISADRNPVTLTSSASTTNVPAAVPVQSDTSEMQLDISESQNGSNGSTNTLTVNGKTVTLPANGTYHEEIQSKDGLTTVHAEQTRSTSGSSVSSSSSVTVESSSSSIGDKPM